jgi:uncharacterized protein (DUF849 family)
MNTDVFVTCAVTGSGDTTGKSPHVPVTPKQIADSAIDAAKAGAAIVHVHVRDPETGKPAPRLELFKEVVDRLRSSSTDVVINLTAGFGAWYVPNADDPGTAGAGSNMMAAAERTRHVEALKPEICSLDVATHNEGEAVYMNSAPMLREMAKRIKAAGVRPELECFDVGQVRLANQLVAEGLIEEPPLYQLCLGINWTAPADGESMLLMRNLLPKNAAWSAFGISRMQMPMAAQSVLLGGNVRVGLEDNLYLSRGVLATNAQLVEKAVGIVAGLGARVLTPEETRRKLGLRRFN